MRIAEKDFNEERLDGSENISTQVKDGITQPRLIIGLESAFKKD